MADTKQITGAELVARTLRALGITTVFGLTGNGRLEGDHETLTDHILQSRLSYNSHPRTNHQSWT
jgi:hypothetical protein